VNLHVRHTVSVEGEDVEWEPTKRGSASFASALEVQVPPLQWAKGAALGTGLRVAVRRRSQP
jgi:hypothetical protein